jgi:putative ABC transport system permease protein
MLKNYIKIAFRNFIQNRVFSTINIVGLAVGLAAFVFILEYIGLEKGVNQFHENTDRMYRVMNYSKNAESWPEIAPGWAKMISNKLPEVESFSRYEQGVGAGIVQNEASNISFRENNIGYAEGNFFNFFSFPLVEGDASDFTAPNTTFISESTAKKYFGDSDAMGKQLVLNNQFKAISYTVKGIFKDMDQHSTIRYDMLFSLETLENPDNLGGNGWANLDNTDSQFIETMLLLHKGSDYKQTEAKLNALYQSLNTENDGTSLRLQPLAHLHIAASLDDDLITTGNLKYIYILSGVALLILLIAWFNYINLSTAASLKRAGEIGVRKAIGATKPQILSQFLTETTILILLSLALGAFLIFTFQPFYNELIGKEASLADLGASSIWLKGAAVLLTVCVFSGLYSAMLMSSFNPVDTLKGKIGGSIKGQWIRKGLVITQFGISAALILATVVIYSQLTFMKNEDLGINAKQTLIVNGPQVTLNEEYNQRRAAFDDFLGKQSIVIGHSVSGSVPGKFYNFKTSGFTHAGSKPDDKYNAYAFLIIDHAYLPTYELPLVAGRNFTKAECEVEWNDNSKIIANEKAIQELGFASYEDALLQGIQWDERHLDIIGITKDYHHTSLHSAIDPILFYPQINSNYYSIKLTQENLPTKIAAIEKAFNESFAGNPFEYSFVDEVFAKAYAEEQQYAQVFSTASGLAVFIACLGLFGLAMFTVESRRKEIGVRKVLGASAASVVGLLSKDFLKLVVIALVIAVPFSAYFMNKWLADFPFRIDIEWWMIGLVSLISLLIALVTISFQCIKGAISNPVESLKSE